MNEVALFESALRAAVRTRPDPRLRAALVPRLAATARASTLEAERQAMRAGTRGRPRSRLASVARVGIAVALIPFVLAGLAFAGVTVPGAARSAFDTVGITLPNQPATDNDATTTRTTTEPSSSDPVDKGAAEGVKSEGERAQKGNSAAAHQQALAQRQKAIKNTRAKDTRGRALGLTGSTPPGQRGQTGPPSHSNAGGSSTRATLTPPPPPPPPDNPGNGQGHSK
ncbi:MAG: hypothetical protein ACM33U_05090 [Solirubrobacterales bacterium]|nr:hypothetical protein [Solirubrobacterales bacterium]